MGGLLGAGALSGGVGCVVALVRRTDVGDAFWMWAIGGLGALTGWAAYSLLLIAVLWALGRAPHTIPGVVESTPSGATHAKSTGETGEWRRRARDPLVPMSLAAFFAIMAGYLFADALSTRHQEQDFSGELRTATATVLRYDDGRWGFGDRKLVVRFEAGGTTITSSVRAEDTDEDTGVPDPGGTLEVEYLPSDPYRVRPAGTAEYKRDDGEFTLVFGAVCAGLAVVCVGANLVGRRRRRRAG